MTGRTAARLVLAIVTVCIGSCRSPTPEPATDPAAAGALIQQMETKIARELLEQAVEEIAAAFPELAVELGESNARWNPPGTSVLTSPLLASWSRRLADSVDEERVPATVAEDIAHLRYGAELASAATAEIVRIDPVNGPHVRLPAFLLQYQPAETEPALRDYLARAASIDDHTRAVITASATAAGADVIEAQCRSLRNGSILLEDFTIRLHRADLDTAVREALLSDAMQEIPSAVAAACDEVLAFAALQDEGSRQPLDYAWQLRRYTSLALDPEAIHTEAAAAVTDLQARLDGLTGPSGPPDGQAVLDQASNFVLDMDPALPSITTIAPDIDLDITVLPPPLAAGCACAGAYSRAHAIGTAWLVPTMTSYFGVEEVAARYAIPGAHLVPRSVMAKVVPIPAFEEGWALYTVVELLPGTAIKGEGMDLKALHEAVAAARVVVDTGLHHHRWTAEQAVDWAAGHLPLPREFLVAMVQAAISAPGRGVAPWVGYRTIIRLREAERSRRGEAFSAETFHDRLLMQGSRPFDIVARRLQSAD